jgi:hypothetical protein
VKVDFSFSRKFRDFNEAFAPSFSLLIALYLVFDEAPFAFENELREFPLDL